ncbi:MAG: hypothetical protein E7Z87_04960 [Cyanobacteria bacterium SIG26]|nr:hypothetical protein [Cyanobacteria bacterium SIG26]
MQVNYNIQSNKLNFGAFKILEPESFERAIALRLNPKHKPELNLIFKSQEKNPVNIEIDLISTSMYSKFRYDNGRPFGHQTESPGWWIFKKSPLPFLKGLAQKADELHASIKEAEAKFPHLKPKKKKGRRPKCN